MSEARFTTARPVPMALGYPGLAASSPLQRVTGAPPVMPIGASVGQRERGSVGPDKRALDVELKLKTLFK